MQNIINPFQNVVIREWQIISKSIALIFMTFVGPILSFLLIVWIFSANVPRDLPVAIVDLDQTALSRQITRWVDATPIASVKRNYTSISDAHKELDAGNIDAILCIPQGTERDVFRGNSAKLALYLNNCNVVKAGLLNSGIRKAIGTLSAGIKLQYQLKNGNNQVQAIARIMPVQLHSSLLFNPYTSYSYYLVLGLIPIVLVVFILLGSIYTLGNELYKGTGVFWLHIANKNIFIALAGKLLPYTLIFFCIAMVMNVILFKYLGTPMHGNFGIIIISELLLILSYQFMALFLVALTTNMRLSLSLGSAYSMLALTYSGLTFPAMGMPIVGQAFSSIFPFTYWLKIFIGQSLRGEPAQNAIAPMLVLCLFVVMGLLLIPRFSRMLITRHRWGKI